MDETLRRVPPHNLDAEVNLLSLLINFPEKMDEVRAELRKEHFYKRIHQEIFDSMLQFDERRERWDDLVLADTLKNSTALKDAGGSAYLSRLMAITPNFNHMSYVRLIVKKARLRRLIDLSAQLLSRAYTEEEDADVLVAEAEKEILKVAELRQERQFQHASHFGELTISTISDLIEMRARGEQPVVGIPTRLQELDRLILGFKRQEMIVIGARPSMGKTAFCLQLAVNIAIEQSQPVVLYSLEMPGSQILMRLFSSLAGVSSYSLLQGTLTQDEIGRIMGAASRIQNSSLFINEQSMMTLYDIRNDLRRLSRELKSSGRDLGVVIIDYLSLISSVQTRSSEQERIAEISRGLKAMAREFDCALVVLSQLSRKVEGRGDKRPMLSDLRESGAIEQDADVVLFLHREEYYEPEKEDVKGKAEVIVAKNRNGAQGIASLFFDKNHSRFRDAAQASPRERS